MLVKVAKSFMGAPYKYGGETVRGLDCSAFVKKIYDIFDVQLPRSAREQFMVGNKISKDELAVGDLVFFKTKRYVKYPTHVGIYIGDGNFIHSSSTRSKLGVKVDALSSDFYSRTFVGATRVKKSTDDVVDIHQNISSSNS
jgi:cell wall-associated NlpC family hydrolase